MNRYFFPADRKIIIPGDFTQQTTTPATTDLNYISHYYGGYNYCIAIDTTTGYVLPNCTGYCWGRWRGILGAYHNLSTGNATNWYGNTSDGYSRGTTAALGAVACWSGGTDGAGHVAIVEEITSSGILCSESAYGSYTFRLNTYPVAMTKSGYSFQGFIYLPGLTYDDIILNRRRRLKIKVV